MPDDARNQNSIMSVRLYCFVTYSEQGQDVKKTGMFSKKPRTFWIFSCLYICRQLKSPAFWLVGKLL